MWKLTGIIALFLQLSTHVAVLEPIHEVELNCAEQLKYDNEYNNFFDCFLMEVLSSKDQIVVTSTNFDENTFKSTKKSVYIKIDGNVNYPEYFPKNLGKFVDGIRDLRYKSTPLKYITRDDFKDMASKLGSINLSENEIEEIPFDTFYDLPDLYYLDIRHNKLKSLAPNLFANSPNLYSLFIKYNEITALSPDLFKNCPEFFVFYAEYNKIEEFHEDLFKNNPKMDVISMRHNKIRNIPIDFNRFKNLSVADFTHNGGTCDTMYFSFNPYDEYYDEEEQKKWIKNVPEFQKKIEEICRQ